VTARRTVAGAALVTAVLACAVPAIAKTRTVSVGNFWYEDDATHDRTKIVANVGDQIAFTVREGVYPPHTVDVDELNIHSPGLLLGETYTTPALSKAGNFKLYCRPHEDRGHVTRLIVQPAPAATTAPGAKPGARATTPPGSAVTVVTPTPAALVPVATLAPVGVRKATPQELRRTVAVDADSLNTLLGRKPNTRPWTQVLWLVLFASVPIVGAAAFALRKRYRSAAVSGRVLPPRPSGAADAAWRASFREHFERDGLPKSPGELAATTALLGRVPLLRGCAPAALDHLAKTAYPIAFDPGDVLIADDADSPECYVVCEGEADVTIRGRIVTHVGPDDVVGNEAPMGDRRRAATVTATTHILAYAISRKGLETILDSRPADERGRARKGRAGRGKPKPARRRRPSAG
jgi:plastocyanin